MSSGLPNGLYAISCRGDGGQEMAVHIDPPGVIGQPVRLAPMEQIRPSPIRIENRGGDSYVLTPGGPPMPGMPCLAAEKEAMPPMILLLPTGAGGDNMTEWAIDRSGPDGQYMIHGTPQSRRGDLCWTARGDRIELREQMGNPTQQWRIEQLERD